MEIVRQLKHKSPSITQHSRSIAIPLIPIMSIHAIIAIMSASNLISYDLISVRHIRNS